MALTERGNLLELWNHVSVFYWQLALSAECVKQTQACRQTFLRSSGRALIFSWAFAMMSQTVSAVKNGFSDLTKEQEGQDRPRKDIMNRPQVNALREGCHERKEAWVGVSSREKINTKKNLVR